MTPSDKTILRALVAVAWADGKVAAPERGVIDGLLAGFGASPEEEKEMHEYASRKRTLGDIPAGELTQDDKETLLANAALLTHADGDQAPEEKALLDRLVTLLGFDDKTATEIIEGAKDGALALSQRALVDEEALRF